MELVKTEIFSRDSIENEIVKILKELGLQFPVRGDSMESALHKVLTGLKYLRSENSALRDDVKKLSEGFLE